MARYELIAHDRAGRPHGRPVLVTAASPGEAVMVGGPTLRRLTDRDCIHADRYAVYRHRRVRGRRLVGAFLPAGPDGPGDGLAGVREPRRPLPAPPSLRAEAELPAYPDI
jgi:hypothetical protein